MATRRRWLLPVLLLLTVACTLGCNPFLLPFLGPEAKQPPLLKKVASDEKGKEVTVVVLTYAGLETRPEFLRADRDLSYLVAKELREAFKANDEKVKVVAPSKVEEFKNNHPDWKKMDLAEIGGRFDADYVVYLELGKLSLYEQGSANLLLHGRAELTVNLVDVNHPDDAPETRELTVTHPGESTGGAISVDDQTPQAFKAEFYKRIATQVAWHFTAHDGHDEHRCD
jgi:hypothetical protein